MRLALIIGGIGAVIGGRAALADDGWKITPSISLQENYNTNVEGGQAVTPGDVVTQITPGVSITGDTPRSTVRLNYAPTYNHFLLGNSPDRIDQNLTSYGTLKPFFNGLTIEYDAYATEAGSSGNQGNIPSSTFVAASDRVLYYIGEFKPHYQAHFRDVATLDAYYRLTSTNTSQQSPVLPGVPSLSNSTLQQEGQIVLGSGESFGRLSSSLNLDYSVGSGTGQNNNSDSNADSVQMEYHVSHDFSVTGSIGYQKIHYDPSPSRIAYTSEGMTWDAGLRATPSPVSSLLLSYGKQQGSYNPHLEVTYYFGARTFLQASYIVTVQNQLQATFSNLQFLSYDQFGNPIDRRTGLPFSGVNQTFASQNVLFRDRPALLSITHEFQRSAVTLSLSYEARSSLTGLKAEDSAWGAVISYSREVTPLLRIQGAIGYTNHVSSGFISNGGEQANVINAQASLIYTLSEATTATATETYFRRISSVPGNNSTTNQLILGIRRDF